MPVLAQTLIDEKNEELDELTAQVQQLQQEAAEYSSSQEAKQKVQQLVSVQKTYNFFCYRISIYRILV